MLSWGAGGEGDWTCSGQVNCPCAEGLGSAKTLGTASPDARRPGGPVFLWIFLPWLEPYGLLWSRQMPLVPRRQFGQEAAQGRGKA